LKNSLIRMDLGAVTRLGLQHRTVPGFLQPPRDDRPVAMVRAGPGLRRGRLPKPIRVEQGSEFISRELNLWTYRHAGGGRVVGLLSDNVPYGSRGILDYIDLTAVASGVREQGRRRVAEISRGGPLPYRDRRKALPAGASLKRPFLAHPVNHID
jgi:hypothetical protein